MGVHDAGGSVALGALEGVTLDGLLLSGVLGAFQLAALHDLVSQNVAGLVNVVHDQIEVEGILAVHIGDDLVAVHDTGNGIALGTLKGVTLDGLLLGGVGSVLQDIGVHDLLSQSIAGLINIVHGQSVVHGVAGVDVGDDLVAVHDAGNSVALGALKGVALDGLLLGGVGSILQNVVLHDLVSQNVAGLVNIVHSQIVVQGVAGVDVGHDLVTVHGAGNGIALGALEGVALDGLLLSGIGGVLQNTGLNDLGSQSHAGLINVVHG